MSEAQLKGNKTKTERNQTDKKQKQKQDQKQDKEKGQEQDQDKGQTIDFADFDLGDVPQFPAYFLQGTVNLG